jgi:hypothetical protein
MPRKRITRKAKKLVTFSSSEKNYNKKTSDLLQDWMQKLSKYYTSMQYFKRDSENFLELPWEEKKKFVLEFLQKFGFKNAAFENGEMSFQYAGVTVHTVSAHDIDALFGGLESAFARLEPELY